MTTPDGTAALLNEALRAVHGPRRDDYGPPDENHRRTAMLWSAYLAARPGPLSLSPEDVAFMNILQKLSRELHAPTRDGLVDVVGYALNVAEIRGY